MNGRAVLVALATCAAVAALAIALLTGRDQHRNQHCTLWQPVLVGKVTTMVCTRWEDDP